MAEEDMDLAAAEAEGEGEGEGGEGKKKSPLKLIIIIVAALAVLGAGAYFGMDMFFGEDEAANEAAEQGEALNEKDKVTEMVVPLDPFIVNLADPSGKRYLKLTLTVDANDEKLAQTLKAQMPRIRDSILLLLTSKTYAEIADVAGKIRLRNAVLKIINDNVIGAGSVHAVYFTEFVIQ
jgi:flagellar FliL protein